MIAPDSSLLSPLCPTPQLQSVRAAIPTKPSSVRAHATGRWVNPVVSVATRYKGWGCIWSVTIASLGLNSLKLRLNITKYY